MATEILKTYSNIDKFQERQVLKIDDAIRRISHQINDVMKFVKGQPLELESVKLSDMIHDAVGTITIPTRIKLFIPKSDPEMLCDYHQFVIVLKNLILNAIQAIGNIGFVEIQYSETDKKIIIKIIDSGPGIHMQNLDKIFEPLFTTKQRGTGLGLSSVKSIIHEHNGTISVNNSPTTFTIELPKKCEPIQSEDY